MGMENIERRTKITAIKNHTETRLHIGDLVSHSFQALSASRTIEGEIVDIARGRVAIQELDGTLAWVFAGFILDEEIVMSAV